MPTPVAQRLDELTLDRRVAGEARGTAASPALKAVYERREVDPTSAHVKRRTGTRRETNTLPNLLGLSSDGNAGELVVDRDFTTEISGARWTVFGTCSIPSSTSTSTYYRRLISFGGVRIYVKKYYDSSSHWVRFEVYPPSSGSVIAQTPADTLELDTAAGNAFRFVVAHSDTTEVTLNAWYVAATPSIPSDVTATHTFAAEKELSLFGSNASALSASYADVVLNNVLVYNAAVFSTSNYDSFALDTTPETSITSPGSATLIWHSTLADGGNVLSYKNNSNAYVSSYLVATSPEKFSPEAGVDPTDIRFGGEGVIEIPFYLDFDEYYWTTTNASARLDWCFQLKVTTPAILSAATVFEFQDLVHLSIFNDSGNFKLRASFHAGAATVTNSVVLAGATEYDIFVARNTSTAYLKVASTEVSATAGNPVIYNYDKTLGFVVGDRVDFENSDPFRGRVERFAFHNTNERAFQERDEAVLYYDVDSISGDEVLDRGNRALNAFLGERASAQAPFYSEGGFEGGSYVAATGGYLVSNSKPHTGYSGELRKPLTKDVVIQRRGRRAFLTSNDVSYIVDDLTKSIRPLGIPRPSTKVTCSPQGIGPIDGFVRYAYRFVSSDGTVGPSFELDPCKATGGVNVFLGAQNFSTPLDPAFGLSYGEAEGGKAAASDNVECFIAYDKDTNSGARLLHKEIAKPGLTLETAFRLPNFKSGAEESVISQGVVCKAGPNTWMARNEPKEFPWIGKKNQECCFQFSFRFKAPTGSAGEASHWTHQTLFGIGPEGQHYKSGGYPKKTRWRLSHLVVSIQPPEVAANGYSIVVCRDDPRGSNHRDDDLIATSFDYNFVDDNDYTIFVSRGGTHFGPGGGTAGEHLAVCIFNHTIDGTTVEGAVQDGWAQWPGSTAAQRIKTNFWGSNYSGNAFDQVMWGACRKDGTQINVKTLTRTTAGQPLNIFNHVPAFFNGTTSAGTRDGQRMYHGRMWRRDHPFAVLASKGLERFGARSGPLQDGLEIDVAFCPDSSVDEIDGGWDSHNGVRVKFNSPNPAPAKVVLPSANKTVFLAYGFNNELAGGGGPTGSAVTSTDKIPLWCTYSDRDGGSLAIGTGQFPSLTIAHRRWHGGSKLQTFSSFGTTIDLTEWNWITLYFHQIKRPGASTKIDVYLERVFINGDTGEWGDLFDVDITSAGPGGKNENTATGPGQYTLFTAGGVPGIDTTYEVETAETRLWSGEVYTAGGFGEGNTTFGPYLSTRIPPNKWNELWHYLRFAPLDVNDMAAQTAMDQVGTYAESGGFSQTTADAVTIYQGAEVKDSSSGSSGGNNYFIPFPDAPLSAIRGIQIFRTQIVPVSSTFPNGKPNPSADIDAFKACRAAPLYYLTEIPTGTNFYFDSAEDTLLGAELNLNEGLIPGSPGGVFEWAGYLGIWSTESPRIYFSASPDSWESFPTDMVIDLPLREYGSIEAAAELASRDARQSRVLVLGKSWGVFIDGSPTAPRVNTMGGGVGAASSRCLVVEKGIAYAYNGTLWAITGDGAAEDIGLPVLDLLPPTSAARLSVSSSLGSLYVINEDTGLTLRWHFARREWFVEDRYALSTTDIDGSDYWVSVNGYPSKGNTAEYADDVESNTADSYTVSSIGNEANTAVIAGASEAAAAGIKVGQRVVIVANEDPRHRQVLTVKSISSLTLTFNENLNLAATGAGGVGASTITYTFSLYAGIGYWGTMLDTGQFANPGVVHHVDLGITSGNRWYAMSLGADFAGDPTSRSGFDVAESFPTRFDDGGGTGRSARWGLLARQRIHRLMVWSFEPTAIGLSELELSQSAD